MTDCPWPSKKRFLALPITHYHSPFKSPACFDRAGLAWYTSKYTASPGALRFPLQAPTYNSSTITLWIGMPTYSIELLFFETVDMLSQALPIAKMLLASIHPHLPFPIRIRTG